MKSVIVFGAGRVASPLVHYLLDQPGYAVTVAALAKQEADVLVKDRPHGRAVEVDVLDVKAVEDLVASSDIVVSLLPAPMTPIVARVAIAHKKSLINTSYVSAEMRALDDDAKRAGVLMLCEIGLDPGIDHMSAVQMIDSVKAAGGRITSFNSCCGGLPAREFNTNPWGYKFSWSPRGVLTAARSDAKYLRNGELIEIDGPDLFSHAWSYLVENEPGPFEIYPNRDSLGYIPLYGLEGVESMFRGTVRYPGWCELMKTMADLGLLDTDVRSWPADVTYAGVTTAKLPPGPGSAIERVAAHLDVDPNGKILARLEWAGLLSDRQLNKPAIAPIDFLTERLQPLMFFGPGEIDLVVLRHEFLATYPGGRREQIVTTLVDKGKPYGDSSMSRTVSLPAAIAARISLEGGLASLTGVHIPVSQAIYRPVLAELEHLGIAFHEHRRSYYPGPLD